MAVNQQDVRVRFSAEGMAEVVTAFQKVAAQGKQSGKETSDAFAALNKQFSALGAQLLGGLSIAVVAGKLTELFKSTLDNAEALTRLSQATGLSTDTIQAFGRAARESGIGSDVANAGLARLTVSLGKAQLSSGASATALAALGLKAKDLAGLTADQKLLLIAQRLAGIQDPGLRAAAATALFGKSVVELIPALVKLGQEGIGVFLAHLQELGLYLDQETIAQLLAAKHRMNELADEAKGLGMQLLVGLLPALQKTTDELAKISKGGQVFKAIGTFAGDAIKVALSAFEIGYNTIVAGAKFAGDMIRGNFKAAFAEWGESFKRDAAGIKKIWAEIPPPPPEAAGGGGGGGADPNADALAKARLALTTQLLENELKLFEAHSKLQLDVEKAAYQAGEISLQEYFKRRAAIISAEYDKQIAIAKAKLKAEQALPAAEGVKADVINLERQTQEAKLKGEIETLNAQRLAALAANQNELDKETLTNKERQASAEEKLLTLEGKRAEAARLRLQIEIETLRRELQASGASPERIAGAVSTAQTQGGAAIDYSEEQKKAQADLLTLETQRKEIQDKLNAGQLFPIQAEQQLLALDRQRLPLLEADAKAMTDFANASKDPTLIAQAAAFNEKIKEIAVSTDQAGAAMAKMKKGIQDAFQSGFNTFVDAAINKTKSLGQAFDDMAKQILKDLVKMGIEAEEQKALAGLFGVGGSPASGATGAAGAAQAQTAAATAAAPILAGGIETGATIGATTLTAALTAAFTAGAEMIQLAILSASAGGGGGAAGAIGDIAGLFAAGASGGQISGPGTSTSDSIPAMLSHGEYVVNAKSTSSWLPTLHAINSGMRAPHYASGGYVARLAAGGVVSAPHGVARPAPITLKIDPDALHMTLRDWFEREVADIAAKR